MALEHCTLVPSALNDQGVVAIVVINQCLTHTTSSCRLGLMLLNVSQSKVKFLLIELIIVSEREAIAFSQECLFSMYTDLCPD